jgi:hypothetical protein
MAIIGFGFTKIVLERLKPSKGQINIQNNIAVKDVAEHELNSPAASKDSKAVRFLFEFTSLYEPKIGSMLFEGEVFYMMEAKQADELVKGWKKDKRIPKEIMPSILNYALNKSNIEAISLSRDIALPPPLPMPRVDAVKKKEEEYIG